MSLLRLIELLQTSAIFHCGARAKKVIVTEAKQNDFTKGWGQCLAELVAAQRLNADSARPVYGIVTDGKLWEFGVLREQTFVKETEGYTVDHIATLFGVLERLFQAATTGCDLSSTS